MKAELAVLEAKSKVDGNFAALRFAIDKKIGFGGRKDWWSGRGRHDSQSCARVHDVSHILLTRVGKGSERRGGRWGIVGRFGLTGSLGLRRCSVSDDCLGRMLGRRRVC